jgi:hypothetical protein
VLLLALLAVLQIWINNPKNIFHRKFGFKLPESAKLENYNYTFFSDETLTMKITFCAEDYDIIVKGLNGYITTDERIELMYSNCKWLGVNENESILVVGHAFLKGKRVMTREVFVAVTKNDKEEYFLYVRH